jgi:hypothetical protein
MSNVASSGAPSAAQNKITGSPRDLEYDITQVKGLLNSYIAKWQAQGVSEQLKSRSTSRKPEGSVVEGWAQKIVVASLTKETTYYKKRINNFNKLAKATEHVSSLLEGLSRDESITIRRASFEFSDSVEARVIEAVGVDEAVGIGLRAIAIKARESSKILSRLLDELPEERGRAIDAAPRKVALIAAQWFCQVTKEIPTYSESSTQGAYGKYTPFLEELFSVFGWEKKSLKTHAQAAIRAVKDEKRDTKADTVESPISKGLLS